MSGHLKDFIVVEEDDDHFQSLKNAFDQLDFDCRPLRVQNSDELIDLLSQPQNAEISHFKPRLIFLGMHLPSEKTWGFLDTRRKKADLRKIPLVVMTGPDIGSDEKQKFYDYGVNSLILRPEDKAEYLRMVDAMGHYWFSIVMLPTAE